MNNWGDLPPLEEVRTTLEMHAELKGQLRILESKLDYQRALAQKQAPRTTHVKVIGVDAESHEIITKLVSEVNAVKAQLDRLQAKLDFFDFLKEVAKIKFFRERV